ncbi:MAG TPA: excinuclease, partial [Cyanobacteria bacterium UBA11148]|nr:excinuclease [Cyanobacteria bacterium UBA11148]
MRIQQISVTGLFGIFDHVIPLNMDERITIIHGPNGFGKTVMLRMLDALFNSHYLVFWTIPFTSFRVKFDNDSSLDIMANSDKSDKSKIINNITFSFYDPNSKKVYVLLNKTTKYLDNEDHQSQDYSNLLARLAKDYEEDIKSLKASEAKSQQESEWLENLKNNIHIRFIESQRLLNSISDGASRLDSRSSSMSPTVSTYSNELAQLIKSKLAEYGTTSQSLDRTFPARVLQQRPSLDLTDEKLRHQLNELEETRSRLIEVGLLDKDENSDFQIEPQAIDESTKNILSVYVEDVEKKLSVFNEIASKIDLLRRIINNKFAYSYKQMNFNKEKGFVFKTLYYPLSSNKETLSSTDLSSGEQHELVLLYELLFKVQPGSLVLIDEPELSLHVGWQSQFLKDLQEITKLVSIDILMAT